MADSKIYIYTTVQKQEKLIAAVCRKDVCKLRI